MALVRGAGVRPQLDRPRLVERVRQSAERGPVLLVAEAGYGKTTLLEAAFARDEGVTAWVTCTTFEQDPGQLLLRLIAAIREAVPGASDVLGDQVAASLQPVDAMVTTRDLLADLERLLVEPLTIVLDQAEHLAAGEATRAIVAEILEPRGAVQVAVATRHPLGIPTARLRTRGMLDELGVADLAFDAHECADYLELATGSTPDDDLVATVLAATEGWPLAVAAVALTLDRGDRPRSLRSPSDIRAFLVEEVLDTLAPAERVAVVNSGVCRYLTPEIATALGLPESFLAAAAAGGLFLRRVESSGTAFTYHPLLRDCLLERLAAERTADEIRALHRRAAAAMAAAGEPVDAIEHSLAAGDWAGAADALAREGVALLGTSPELVRDWLGRLPPETRGTPNVRMLEGQLEWFTGDLDAAADLLRGCLDEADFDPTTAWLARYRLMEVMYVAGRLDDAVALGAGFETASPEESALAAGVGMLAANCLAALGRGEESDEVAAAAARLPGAAAAATMDALRRGHLDVPAGRLDEALQRQASVLAELDRGDPFRSRMSVLTGISYIVTEQGDPARALEWWRRVEGEAEAGLVTRNLGPSRAWQALLLVRSRRPAEAERLLATAGVTEAGWVGYIHDVAGAVVAAARGDRQETLAAAERAVERVSPAPALYRVWAAGDLLPALVQVGAVDHAARLHADTAALVERVYPGGAGRFFRARLDTLGAWLAAARGDDTAADDHLLRLFEGPLAGAHYVLVREWSRVEPLVWSALERGLLPAEAAMQVVVRAFPDGLALVPFVEHPNPTVRRVSIAPALASGHPKVLPLLAELGIDPDPDVAAAARAAEGTIARTRPPRRFTVLGGFSVRRGAWVVDERSWGRPIAARLVRYLLVHAGTRVPEEVLLEAFWPELSVGGARRSLQVAASRVRAALDDPGAVLSVLVVADGTYRLELDPADTVDSDEFEAAAAAAMATNPPARRALEHAAALWTGEPLPEERYEDWATTWREHLVDRYAVVLTELAAACERDRDHVGAVDAARRLVALDPFDEAAHRELMVAYARGGRRAAALRQYLECRRVLVDGIGLEPGEATSRLQARILAGDEV